MLFFSTRGCLGRSYWCLAAATDEALLVLGLPASLIASSKLLLVWVVKVIVASAATGAAVWVRLYEWCLLTVCSRVEDNLLARRRAVILPW